MFRNYFIIAWRNILKSTGFSFINIAGLALGLACSMLIGLWVLDEYSIDAFHENIDRMYVVTSCEYSGSEISGSYDTPGRLAEEIKITMPEVEYASNFAWTGYNTFAAGDKKMKLPGNFASPDFFRMFSYPLLLGDKNKALLFPESIAISRAMAVKLFGSPEKAIDQSVLFENYRDLKVTAVFEDLPDNTSDKFEYIASWEFFLERNPWAKDFNNSGPTTYLTLKQGTDTQSFSKKIQHFIKAYDPEYSDLDRLELGIQPYKDQYLKSGFENGYPSGDGRIAYVRIFSWVAVLVLLLACINFMNLSTARAVKRAKEIGIRKVVGAARTMLTSQFLMEAFVYTSIAVLLAIGSVQLLLPAFNLLAGKNIESPAGNPVFWLATGMLTLITAFVAGSYPAFMLSSFKPVSVLRDRLKMDSTSVFFRKGLVVLQFSMTMIFIFGMIVVNLQVDFIHLKNIGYEKSNLVFVPLTGNIAQNFELFKNELKQSNGVASVSYISQRPMEIMNSTGSVEWEGKDPGTRPTFTQVAVGYDFLLTMEANLIGGRDFSEQHNDSANYLINEAAVSVIGYEDPVGRPLTFWDVKGTIVGVVKDFHFNSLHVPIRPLVIRLNKGNSWGTALVRIVPGKTAEALASIEATHQKLNPDFPFAHQFADEEYGALYRREAVVKQLSQYFSFLAIVISCLGLLGLVIFTAEQRTKEIGIRKALGASITSVCVLLSKDFVKLVLVAALFSVPFAWYFMREWLSSFEYHIDLAWWMFAFSAASALVMALATISFRAIQAALANPVESLKSE